MAVPIAWRILPIRVGVAVTAIAAVLSTRFFPGVDRGVTSSSAPSGTEEMGPGVTFENLAVGSWGGLGEVEGKVAMLDEREGLGDSLIEEERSAGNVILKSTN